MGRHSLTREGMAQAMNARGEFTILDIACDTKATRTNVQHFVCALVKKGDVQVIRKEASARGHLGMALYRVVKKLAPTATAQREQMRARIWRSMRVMRRFTIADLCATAEARPWFVANYAAGLIKHGYLLTSSAKANRRQVCILARDTGPKPPRPRADGSIDDPNLVSGELSRAASGASPEAERSGVEGRSK